MFVTHDDLRQIQDRIERRDVAHQEKLARRRLEIVVN